MKTFRGLIQETKHDLDREPSHSIAQRYTDLAGDHFREARNHPKGTLDHHRHMLIALTSDKEALAAAWEHRAANRRDPQLDFHSNVLDYLGDRSFHQRTAPHWEKFNEIRRKYVR